MCQAFQRCACVSVSRYMNCDRSPVSRGHSTRRQWSIRRQYVSIRIGTRSATSRTVSRKAVLSPLAMNSDRLKVARFITWYRLRARVRERCARPAPLTASLQPVAFRVPVGATWRTGRETRGMGSAASDLRRATRAAQPTTRCSSMDTCYTPQHITQMRGNTFSRCLGRGRRRSGNGARRHTSKRGRGAGVHRGSHSGGCASRCHTGRPRAPPSGWRAGGATEGIARRRVFRVRATPPGRAGAGECTSCRRSGECDAGGGMWWRARTVPKQ